MLNGNSTKLSKKIIDEFKQTFHINSLYQYCYRLYKEQQSQLNRKYSNLFAYLHLLNTRSVQSAKEDKFIKDWHNIFNTNHNYCISKQNVQEIVKLIELLEEKKKQILFFIKFLNDISKQDWTPLKDQLTIKIDRFVTKIQKALNDSLQKGKKSKKNELKHRLKIIYEIENKQKIIQLPQDIEDEDLSLNNKTAQDFRNSLCLNNSQDKDMSLCPYTAGAIKFSIKEKPEPIKLLSQEEVKNIRRSYMQRNKSTLATLSDSLKDSQKTTEYKFKNQNFVTLHTQISEEDNEHNSQDKNEEFRLTPVQQFQSDKINKILSHKKTLSRQHKSTFQDSNKFSSFFGSKEITRKQFNSIHKIQSRDSHLKGKNNAEAPSRYTIQSSSMVRLKSVDSRSGFQPTIKKSRISKVSLNCKLQTKSINKMHTVSRMKDNKRQRGGFLMPKNEQLRQIKQIQQNIVNQDTKSQSSSSSSSSKQNAPLSDSSSQSSNKQIWKPNQNQNLNDSVHFDSSKLFKGNSIQNKKMKRRFGVSTKKVRSFKSMDSYANIKYPSVKSNSALGKTGSRTSFFRSSGFTNNQDKKSILKSKYSQKEDKKIRFLQSQNHIEEEIDTKIQQQNDKSIIIKRSYNNINSEQTYDVDQRGVVSKKEMRKILTEIHEQDQKDRSSAYEEYYEELNKRKYQGGQNIYSEAYDITKPSFFKIQKIDHAPKVVPHISMAEVKLFDFMTKNIRKYQESTLIQCGVSSRIE